MGSRLALLAPLSGGRPGVIPDSFERLAPLLESDHEVVTASTRAGRLTRPVDMLRTLRRDRRTLDAVVFHLYSGRAFATADVVSRAVRQWGLPLVGYLSGGGFPDFAPRHPRWVRTVLGRFDLLVAPSDHLADWARAVGRQAIAIPNPLDVDEYVFAERAPLRPRLFWMRSYHEIYRPTVALDVLERVRRRHPSARLTMAGPDKGERVVVEDEVARRGLGEHVDVRGFVGPAEKRGLLADHDVFLNTPAVDNRPVCLVEAGASGLVIVSTDAGGIPALVEHGQSALLAPVDDADGLAAAVGRVLDEPDLARRLARGGHAVAQEGRPERVLDRWNDVLDDLLTVG